MTSAIADPVADPDLRPDLAVDRAAADVAAEVRALLAGPRARDALAAVAAARRAGTDLDPRPLYRLLGEHRLLAVSWPRAYGGRGLPARCAAAVVGELIAGGVPEVLHTLSVQICGTFLLTAGSAEQRAAVLPGLASGRRTATVLYSEPGVGSDLSALQTTAEATANGGWRISGRKVYSVGTALADHGLVAARTAVEPSPYRGITLFLVPLDRPGITIGRLESLADDDFADVRLDDVEIPASAVIGPVGGAWPLITEALALERTGVDYVAKARRWLAAAPPADSRARTEYGRLRTHTAAAAALATRCVDQLDTGRVDAVAAAATKLWCADTARAVAWWCAEEAGPAALWRSGDGLLEPAYREAPGLTLSAGTSEMMLEFVASSGLPLPEVGEPLAAELRAACRAVASAYDERDPAGACWPDLARLGVFGMTVPAERGGLDLGLRAAVICSAELGRELHDGGLLDTLTALDVRTRTGRELPTLDGRWRAVLADLRLPGRPVHDPRAADTRLAVLDGPAIALAPDLTFHPHDTAEGPLWTAHGAAGEILLDGAAAVEVLAAGRVRRAAWLLGLAAGCLEHTCERARTREQFGRTLYANQDVAFRLARLAVRLDALTALVTDLAGRFDDGAPEPALAAGALAEAGTLALDAGREGVHLHGAFGMTAGSPVRRHYLAAPIAVAADAAPAALRTEAADHD
ncbi:MAG TPA: acyl-CoA dehydrogenase family protein [Actinophytocola sp.]|nr:acyl-CoA dehydrogenase family protein [Actinophytocola sp.]